MKKKHRNWNIVWFVFLFWEIKLPFGSTASSYEGGGPLETPWCAGTVPGISW